MANHCHQSLIIKGNQSTIEEILTLLNEDDKYISFSNIIPIPSDGELKELQLSKSEWCTKTYEVYCDFGILHGTEITENQVRIDFHTNYTPCREFVYQLCHLYTDLNLELSFVEPYGGFRGYVECENGVVLQEHFEDIEWETLDEDTGEVINFSAESESIPDTSMTEIEDFLTSI